LRAKALTAICRRWPSVQFVRRDRREYFAQHFSAVVIPPGRVLLLDCEIKLPGLKNPVSTFGIAHASATYLPFVVLGTLALFAELGVLEFVQYTPKWQNRSIALSSFIQDEPDGSPLREGALTYVSEMTPDGFQFTTRNVSADLYHHCINVGVAASQKPRI
jgi:hypothetical protein